MAGVGQPDRDFPPMASLPDLVGRLARGETSSEAVVRAALARIEDASGEGAVTFTRVYRERALEEARRADEVRRRGAAGGPLAGVPISIKDLFDVAGEPTLAGSVVLRDAPPAGRDAEIVARLRAAGAIVVGKTNMTEFAFSGLGLNPHYGTPRAPWDRAAGRIPGGSSSGAAVSVAEGMAVVGIGTDTGGSVRIPAACCGLVGFKPTARRVSRAGALPLSTTLDSVGPIAPTVACCAAIDAVLSGEPTHPVREQPARGLRFAAPRRYVWADVDREVARALDRARARVVAAGAEIVDVECAELEALPEINAKGGFASYEAFRWHAPLIERARAGYDPRVLVRILRGAETTAQELATLAVRRGDFQRQLARSMAGFDALWLPTIPIVPPPIAPLAASDEAYMRANYLVLRNPSMVNFFDGCAISLPCHDRGDAPVGLMLVARPGEDRRLLEVAQAIERILRP
jgi:aspartyl-tRNA(Asn)/glutamyl-tRNA(Gln) amidotransferase subunit A